MFRDRTADVPYCADITPFLHATSGRLSLTAAFFLRRFLTFITLNAIWAHFLGHPILYPLNTLAQRGSSVGSMSAWHASSPEFDSQNIKLGGGQDAQATVSSPPPDIILKMFF